MFSKISHILERYSKSLLLLGILSFLLISCYLTVWKFVSFQYNALDLGIFTQVAHQTSLGNWFQFSIHPSLYLGDHLGFILLPLSFIYKIFPSPITLLIIQNFIIALCIIPLYHITYSISRRKNLSVIVSWIWLLNPYTHNMATFEFHLLPFAMFFGFCMFYFYQKKRFFWFLVFMILALLTREDVALFTSTFGILAFIEKRSKKWILIPILLSATYFIFGMQLINHFSPDSTYKFVQYYSWIQGETMFDRTIFLLIHPIQILAHLFHPGNILFFFALFIPVMFLSFISARFLVLGILIFLQYALSEFFGSPIILQTHYTALLLPGIFISMIYGLNFLISNTPPKTLFQKKILKLFYWDKTLFAIIIFCGIFYSSITWGTLFRGTYTSFYDNDSIGAFSSSLHTLIDSIPENTPIISSYRFLPHLAERSSLYSLHYVFIGQQQYSETPYPFPEDTEYIIMDSTDSLLYERQFSQHPIYRANYITAHEKLQKSLIQNNFGIAAYFDSYILWQKNVSSSFSLYSIFDEDDRSPVDLLDGNLLYLGHEVFSYDYPFLSPELSLLPISFEWGIQGATEKNYKLLLEIIDSSGKSVYQKKYPLVHGLFKTSSLHSSENIRVQYTFALPHEYLKSDNTIRFSVYTSSSGYPALNSYNTAELKEELDVLEPFLSLPVLTVFPEIE